MKKKYDETVKKEMIRLHKEEFMTYREIGLKYGISRQRIQQIIGKASVYHFKPISEKACIYVGIRNWMNDNYISLSELCRRLYGNTLPNNYQRMFGHIRYGKDMRKSDVDKYLKITGLTYEVAFAIGE